MLHPLLVVLIMFLLKQHGGSWGRRDIHAFHRHCAEIASEHLKMSLEETSFAEQFFALTGHAPMLWQQRLFDVFKLGNIPTSLDLPTGLGKTSVMAIWLLARALGDNEALKKIPRRLVYIVDRRAVVDQATAVAAELADALEASGSLEPLPGLTGGLAVSTLRGRYADNRRWLADPSAHAIVVGTVDMIGSRLLFEGYGVSPKMRPYHAGLLGVDTLVVLDEAHLVPAFEELLRAIEGQRALWGADCKSVRPLIVLPLSATQRGSDSRSASDKSFGLGPEDQTDGIAAQRLNACKKLQIKSLAEKEQDKQLAEVAWALATQNGPARVVVFCNRREKKDDGNGPSALGVAEAIRDEVKRRKLEVESPVLLVGSRRVHERDGIEESLRKLGFIDCAKKPEKPVLLIATSAGEVGVDLDADHMVCDLVPWERMVQRLGRVNRRGGEGREAEVIVFDTSDGEKNEDAKARLLETRTLLRRIEVDFGGQAGPVMLLELLKQLGSEEIQKASTPEPLYPALTRAVVDAWSMTSLEQHSGRPDIAPWLRGWADDDKPQTALVWRKFLPVRLGSEVSKKEIEDFFEAAPAHVSELLETESFRVPKWLSARAKAVLKSVRSENAASGDNDGAVVSSPEVPLSLNEGNVVCFVLDGAGRFRRSYRLKDLAVADKDLERELAAATLVLDFRLAGLSGDGMLDEGEENKPRTADDGEPWNSPTGFRASAMEPDRDSLDWHESYRFTVKPSEGEGASACIYIEGLNEERRAQSGNVQLLADHQRCAGEKAREIGIAVGLSGVALEALVLAARLHDEGKQALRWQRAFRAPHEKDEAGKTKIFAKTRGPVNLNALDGYRHEFGSLLYAEKHPEVQALEGGWRDLVLHLIASHHGGARPVISTKGCEDAPPSALADCAREVALRFAVLQKRWGPWGLAWWEALLRAADQIASRENDKADKVAPSQAEKS